MTTKIEAPLFSVSEVGEGQLLFRVDSGKYLDSVFRYGTIGFNEETRNIQYTVEFSVLVVNGVQRDVQSGTSIDVVQQFYDEVATPILDEVRLLTP